MIWDLFRQHSETDQDIMGLLRKHTETDEALANAISEISNALSKSR